MGLEVGDEPPPLRPPAPRRERRVQTADRFGVINAFVDETLRDLSRAEFAVWMILWRDTKPNGNARTSQVDMARRAGLNVRSVKRALRKLCAKGLVKVVYQGGFRRGVSTYRVGARASP